MKGDLEDIGWEGMDPVHLDQNRDTGSCERDNVDHKYLLINKCFTQLHVYCGGYVTLFKMFSFVSS
jgi:hypothetical protein